MMTNEFNVCVREGIFSDRWKRARLTLLTNPRKPEGVSSSYRPLCLLNDVEKIFKLDIQMEAHMTSLRVELSKRQLGYGEGGSTDDALRLLHEWDTKRGLFPTLKHQREKGSCAQSWSVWVSRHTSKTNFRFVPRQTGFALLDRRSERAGDQAGHLWSLSKFHARPAPIEHRIRYRAPLPTFWKGYHDRLRGPNDGREREGYD